MRRSALVRAAPLLVLGVGLAVSGVLFANLARGLWFFGDDFDFLLNRTVTLNGDHGLLEPHNEHWSTIPILLFRIHFATFGLHHYLPYALVPIGFHVLICLLSFVLLRLCDVGRWVSTLAALVVAFSAGAAGAENTLWDFQAGFLGSCLFGLVALVVFASARFGRVGRAVGVAALLASLMSSGMGIVMVLWAAVFLLVRDGLRTALVTVAVPAVVYLTWFGAYGRGHTGAPPVDLAVAPVVAMRGLGVIWSAVSGTPGAGPIMLLVMVAAVVLPRHRDRLFAVAGSGLVAVVATYALLGYSRSGIGLDATNRSRYVYFGVVLTLPALAAGMQSLSVALARRPVRIAVVAWLATATVVMAVGAAQADRWAGSRRSLIGDNRARVVAAARLIQSGALLLRAQPMPERNPDVSVAALSKPSVRAAIPDIEPGRRAELDVAAHLQVDVGAVARSFAPPDGIRWLDFEPAEAPSSNPSARAACVSRTARSGGVIEVPGTATGMELRLTVSGPEVGTRLVSDNQHSPLVHWRTLPGQPVYVASTAADAELRIVVPPGNVTVCDS